MTRQNASQAATCIQETQQSITTDEADLKAHSEKMKKRLAKGGEMTVLVLYVADS